MAEPNKSTTTSTVDHNHTRPELTVSDEDPPALTTAIQKKDSSAAANSDCIPPTKRRKKCPESLDKIQELAPLNQTFSFTFDTKATACTPEVTPKFGSFNSGKDSKPLIARNQGFEIPARVLETKEEEDVGDGREVREEPEVLGVLINDGIE